MMAPSTTILIAVTLLLSLGQSHASHPRGTSCNTPPKNCNADNCLRAVRNTAIAPSASAFCSSFLLTSVTPTATATPPLPTWLKNCGSTTVIERVSSACSCFLPSLSTTTQDPTPTPSASTTEHPTSDSTISSSATLESSIGISSSAEPSVDSSISVSRSDSSAEPSSTSSILLSSIDSSVPPPSSGTPSDSPTSCPLPSITTATETTTETITLPPAECTPDPSSSASCPSPSTVTSTITSVTTIMNPEQQNTCSQPVLNTGFERPGGLYPWHTRVTGAGGRVEVVNMVPPAGRVLQFRSFLEMFTTVRSGTLFVGQGISICEGEYQVRFSFYASDDHAASWRFIPRVRTMRGDIMAQGITRSERLQWTAVSSETWWLDAGAGEVELEIVPLTARADATLFLDDIQLVRVG